MIKINIQLTCTVYEAYVTKFEVDMLGCTLIFELQFQKLDCGIYILQRTTFLIITQYCIKRL